MYNWIELKKIADWDYFIPGSSVFRKGGGNGGEHVKLYLKRTMSNTFQATSVVVSMVFYWSECYVKPVNEEQLL